VSRLSEPIVYIDRSEIRAGKLNELKRAVTGLVEFVDRHEPQLLSYRFFIEEKARQLTVVAVHPNPASLEIHMDVAGSEFRKMSEFIELKTIEVYGRPTEKALNQLRQKAEMLGEGRSVVVHEPQAGFAR
jgi:hypothetical protein